jgi:photosystem II stability/assembly factor-like uncharacterized protein
MKKLLLLAFSTLVGNVLVAQPLSPVSRSGPVKFTDRLAQYKASIGDDGDEPEKVKKIGKVVEEDEHYHLGKWEWYWRQHCDDNGYIISPVRTLEAWQQYTAEHKEGAAKGTSLPSNWVFQGPKYSYGGYSGLGRVNVVAFDPVDSNTFYVGSPAGSTWKTTDGGNTWAALYDNLPTLGVADIKVNPLNRNTIYVATGDGDAGDTYSSGVIKSYNGGATWLTTGLTWPPTAYNMARSLLINPLDTNRMILASDAGIYITGNAGATWTHPSTLNFKQVLYKPGDTSIVYGSVYTDSSAQIMRSVNGGITWSAVTGFNDAQRINLAVTPADPALVIAIASNNSSGLKGIYRSSNSGLTFSPAFINDTFCVNNLLGYELGLPSTSCGGQGWYDLCIAIDPVDPDKVTIGGVNNYFSADGGFSWNLANQWYGGMTGVETVHADKHWLAYNPLNGALFLGCDGGVYRTYQPFGGIWTDLTNGIGITEFYRNAVSNGATFCLGGAQDNGTKMIDGSGATDVMGGDGMQCLINYADPNVFYCSYQNGSVGITRDGGGSFASITDVLGGSGAWITPYVLHPHDTATLVLAYKNVYASTDNGTSWLPISPVFDTNYNVELMAIANSNPNYIYTVYNDYSVWRSVIHYTSDFGASWDTIHVPIANFITDIAIHPRNEKTFWVTIGGYGSSRVYKYNLATNTWTNENGGLPNFPVDCIVVDTSTLTRYVGTDAAVFYKDTTMVNWALYNNHLPTVHVYDLNINYTTGELWAATYGRGMWKSGKAEVNGIAGAPQVAAAITIAPNPAHGTVVISSSGISTGNTNAELRIIAADGKTIMQTAGVFDGNGSLKLDIKGIPAGFYICEVSSNNSSARGKLVVY